jgi:hypothetical protein
LLASHTLVRAVTVLLGRTNKEFGFRLKSPVGLSKGTFVNFDYLCCGIPYKMSETNEEKEKEFEERKAIPKEPTEVSGAKESKGAE